MPTQTSNLVDHYQSQRNFILNVWKEFAKPIHENIFFRNMDYLLRQCDLYTFNNDKWIRRPHIYSEDIYGEQYYYPVIMLMNNIGSLFSFVPDSFIDRKILTPTEDDIETVMNLPTM